MSQLKVCTFSALIPVKDKQQSIPTYGSGKRPQAELESLAKTDEYSYIRVVKPQYLDAQIEQGTDAFYQASQSHLNRLIATHSLERVENVMFLYEQVQPGVKPLRGLILAVDAHQCMDGSVKKHENVLESKASRLVKHIAALNSISEPVLLAQKMPTSVLEIFHQSKNEESLITTVDVLGFEHKIWPLSVQEVGLVIAAFNEFDSLYIADGHHRVAAVSEYLLNSGKSKQHGLMSLVMDQDDLLIKSFHRIIKGVGNVDFAAYFTENQIPFETIASLNDCKVGANEALVIAKENSYLFQLGEVASTMNAVEKLEVSRVESGIFKQLLNIQNTSTDERISFVRGDIPCQEMQDMVKNGACDCVFVLAANSFHQVEDVADQNLTMPPKSTWVEPKLLTGFVSQIFD